MAKKKSGNLMEKVGGWSFLIGFLVAVVLGIFGYTAPMLLLVLGLLVGLLNIQDKEIIPFLIAVVALIVVGGVDHGISWLNAILSNVNLFVMPAGVIAALKAVYSLARD